MLRSTVTNFEPEGSTELKLKIGDVVSVTHDPEMVQANANRWVYGTNETTQDTGWFPLSHTVRIVAPTVTSTSSKEQDASPDSEVPVGFITPEGS